VNRVHNIVSVSTDGHLCVWSDNNLYAPSSEIYFNRKEEITTNSFDFPGRETNNILLGSDEGYVYKAHIYDQKGIYESVKAHSAPITNIHCHPLYKNKPGVSNLANFYLTSSYDWTVKLWNSKLKRPLLTFESSRDYVYDVRWSPTHPAVFASGDGTGKLDVWNLNTDTEVPMYSTKINENPAPVGEMAAISRLQWSQDGKLLAVGTSTGNVHLYEMSGELASPAKEASDIFYDKIARWTSTGQANKEEDTPGPDRALSPSGSSSGGTGSTALGLDKASDSDLLDHKENN